MIEGSFGSKGELYFEIDLIADDGSIITVNALLDTGFTDWLAMDIQDIESLEWSLEGEEKKQTARGEAVFFRYAGCVMIDNQEFAIPVLGGEAITEVLIGLPWLETRRLVVDRKVGLLTLGEE
ncbi:MAG TPA: aspartyl protease [Cyanobacteria bacterium UBA12227]|nr:aspartyl protease [Cyanobacteria bacterium UBA12227]HAX86494.1 aspartyl protease [Cyanobacteria bacterium UBA11370]